MSALRTAYVSTVRGARSVADRVGLLDRMAHSPSPRVRHLRTQFAIFDADDLASLDLPWWVYGAAERIDAFLRERAGTATVFEYGCGASTLWLARRAGAVHSVEHDGAFVDFMAGRLAAHPHVDLRFVRAAAVDGAPATPSGRAGHEHLDFTDYVAAVDAGAERYDLIVIDGRARSACLRRAVPRLAPDGLLVFDNSNRKRYQAALHSTDLTVERVRGATPTLPLPSETALLRHRVSRYA